MKALTLWQPWASLVALGVKTIETRPWRTSYRGPLAIHAALKPPERSARVGDYVVHRPYSPEDAPWELWAEARHLRHTNVELPLGAVVATCYLADCIPTDNPGTRWSVDAAVSWHVIHPGGDPDIALAVFAETQRPYGGFAPGRWAWLLADVKAVDPSVPATGHQGLWNWDET